MGKSRNRFHAAKQDRSSLTTHRQAPPTRFKRPTNQKLRKEATESPTDQNEGTDDGTDDDLPGDRGLKSRKGNSRKAKRSLAGAKHRRLASASLKRRGKAAKNSVHKTKTKKKKKNSDKPKEAVEKAPTDYGDDRRTLVAYTDGSCLNAERNAAAGIGVWWGTEDERNLSERCPGRQNSNRAEIFAIVRLLEETPMIGRRGRLVIRTDSRSAIQWAMNLGRRCQTRGWTTASGNEVKDAVGHVSELYQTRNRPMNSTDMIQYMLALLSLRATRGEIVVFEHVRAHSKNVGNDGADALAKRGTKEPTLPDRDWLARRLLVEAIQDRVRSS